MKKRIIISLLCGLVVCCMAAYSFGTTGIVKPNTLRLRSSNSTDSSIITLLSANDKVEILTRTENDWYKVKYTDASTQKVYEGYVSGDYITVQQDEINMNTNPSKENENLEEENTPSEEIDTKEDSNNKFINKGEKIYIIPLINSNTTNILEKDVTVEVIVELNGWSYVTSDSIEGWVRTEKLQEVGAKKKIGYINTESVNFREQPTTSSTSMLKLPKNAEVEIIEEDNEWTKIEYKENVGYVTTRYISDTKVQVTSRSNTRRTATTSSESTVETTENTITNTSNTETSTITSEIVAYAKQYLGYKYVSGGASPSGFDCSGFTQYVYKHFGYSLSRTSASQAKNGVAIEKSNLQLGDIICFSSSSKSTTISHVGIYIGGGKFIHAANSKKGVITSNLDGDGFFYVSARRIVQ